jgi:hypothetical protein
MRKSLRALPLIALLLCLVAVLSALPSEVDGQLTARRRLFSSIGAGLREVRHAANGNYYVLASPSVGVAIFDSKFKQLSVIGAPANSDTLKSAQQPAFGFGEDCDVDSQGNIYIADRSDNLVVAFSPDGKKLRSFPVEEQPVSIAALPDGEVAVTTLQRTHLVTVYGSNGKVAREFGNLESVSTRADIDKIVNYGRVVSDPEGHVYFGFTYLPEPLVRQYDRFGYGGQAFEFTGVDAYPEAQATRKEIERFESNNKPAALRPILTAFGVDPVSGDVWMGLHNTLVHFDKEGNRRSEYLVYTPKGARLEASIIVVQDETLLIGSDPLGVYEFQRPDKLR